MASVNVTIRMDANDKAQAEKLFSEFGLTMNASLSRQLESRAFLSKS